MPIIVTGAGKTNDDSRFKKVDSDDQNTSIVPFNHSRSNGPSNRPPRESQFDSSTSLVPFNRSPSNRPSGRSARESQFDDSTSLETFNRSPSNRPSNRSPRESQYKDVDGEGTASPAPFNRSPSNRPSNRPPRESQFDGSTSLVPFNGSPSNRTSKRSPRESQYQDADREDTASSNRPSQRQTQGPDQRDAAKRLAQRKQSLFAPAAPQAFRKAKTDTTAISMQKFDGLDSNRALSPVAGDEAQPPVRPSKNRISKAPQQGALLRPSMNRTSKRMEQEAVSGSLAKTYGTQEAPLRPSTNRISKRVEQENESGPQLRPSMNRISKRVEQENESGPQLRPSMNRISKRVDQENESGPQLRPSTNRISKLVEQENESGPQLRPSTNRISKRVEEEAEYDSSATKHETPKQLNTNSGGLAKGPALRRASTEKVRQKVTLSVDHDDDEELTASVLVEKESLAKKRAVFMSSLGRPSEKWTSREQFLAQVGQDEDSFQKQASLSAVSKSYSSQSTFRREQKTERCEAWLYQLPILKPCSETFIETLAPKMMRQVFKENNIITYQSHEVNRLYVINFGRVKITIEDFNIGELTQGHFWGEQICLKPLTNSTATYTASCVCMTYSLEKKSFHDILRKHPNEMKNFQTPPPDEEAQLARAANPELQLKLQKRQTDEDGDDAEGSMSSVGKQQSGRDIEVTIYTIPMFWDCESDFLYQINLYLHRQMYFQHQLLMKEGTRGETCIILNIGVVVVTVASRKVAELKDGAIFGELAVLGISEARSATVQAVSVCKVQVLHRSALLAALEQFPAESKRFQKLIESRSPGRDDRGEGKAHKLRSVEFFKECSERFLFLLQDKCEERLYIGGQTVVHEGADGDAIYIIIRGSCEAFVLGQVVGTLEEGAVFGESAALGLTPKTTATVKAKASCFIQILHRAVLLHALDMCPEERNMFFKLSNQRLTKTTKRMSLSKPTLDSYDFFKNCSAGFLEAIRSDVKDKIFLPGQEICTQGFEGSTCFILHQGNAEVLRNDIQLTTYGPGAFFGEFAVLGLTTLREATVKATAVCLVEEITRESLWGVMHDYPAESKIFEDLVGEHLEGTVHDAMQNCDFFQSWDNRVVTFLTLHAERKVFAPGQWIVREHFLGDAMFILNRGNATSHMDTQEVGLLRAGDYMCATVLLGIHKTYKVGYKAKTMCHLVAVARAEYTKAMDQYKVEKHWLKDMEKHEVVLFDREFKKMKTRCKELQIQQRMKRNFGSMLNHNNSHNPGLDDVTLAPNAELQLRVFNAWMALIHSEKPVKGRFGPKIAFGGKSLLGKSIGLKRRHGTGGESSRLGMLPAISNAASSSEGGELADVQENEGEADEANEGVRLVPVQEDVGTDVTSLLRQLLECSDVKTLYHDPAAERWHTDYRVFKGPGIPEPPPNPWGPLSTNSFESKSGLSQANFKATRAAKPPMLKISTSTEMQR